MVDLAIIASRFEKIRPPFMVHSLSLMDHGIDVPVVQIPGWYVYVVVPCRTHIHGCGTNGSSVMKNHLLFIHFHHPRVQLEVIHSPLSYIVHEASTMLFQKFASSQQPRVQLKSSVSPAV